MKNISSKKHLQPRDPPGHFIRNERGGSALEFALLAPCFFFMIFAIFEICLAFIIRQNVVNAVDHVARQISTGQIKNGQNIHELICENLFILKQPVCSTLKIDLRAYQSFKEVQKIIKNLPVSPGEFKVDPFHADDIIVFAVHYSWPKITGFLSLDSSGQSLLNTDHLHQIVWQNEPYQEEAEL